MGHQQTIQNRGSFLQRGTAWRKNGCAHKSNLAWQYLRRTLAERRGREQAHGVTNTESIRGQEHKDRRTGRRQEKNDPMGWLAGCKRQVRHSVTARGEREEGGWPLPRFTQSPKETAAGDGEEEGEPTHAAELHATREPRGSFPRRRPGPQSPRIDTLAPPRAIRPLGVLGGDF